MDKVTEDQEFNVENVENISVLKVRKLFKEMFDKQQKDIYLNLDKWNPG